MRGTQLEYKVNYFIFVTFHREMKSNDSSFYYIYLTSVVTKSPTDCVERKPDLTKYDAWYASHGILGI